VTMGWKCCFSIYFLPDCINGANNKIFINVDIWWKLNNYWLL